MTRGAKPSDGSSNRSKRGRLIRARYRKHLLFAAAQTAGQLGATLAQTREQRIAAIDVAADLGTVLADVRADLQVLLDRQFRKRSPSLRNVCNAEPGHLLGTHTDQFSAAHADTALAVHHLTDGPDRRGLARTVRAEQHDDLGFVHVQVDFAEHLDRAVTSIQAGDLQHRAHRLALISR